MSEKQFAIGIDLGGTTIKAGIVDDKGSIVDQLTTDSRAAFGPPAVIAQLEKTIDDLLRKYPAESCRGIGIGSPGVVIDGSIVKNPPNFAQWEEVDLGGAIRARVSLPVEVQNDANVAAVGESRFGAGIKYSSFLFVIWGTGVGGGIIIDRKIFYGSHGGAGEIGHVSIDMNGPQCKCGNRGCIESYIGQKYLSERTRTRLSGLGPAGQRSKINELVGGDSAKIEPRIIAQAAEEGDQIAREIFTEAGTYLGYALASILNVLDLRVVIIGGGVSAAPQFVYDAILDATRSRVLTPHRSRLRIVRAELGNRAGIIGAASLVM